MSAERPPPPAGFPPDLGEGPGEADALLLLRCLLGITPRRLHELLWETGGAGRAVAAITAGLAGSDHDRKFLAAASVDRLRERLRNAGARYAPPGHPDYWPAFVRLADPPVGVFVRGGALAAGARRVAVVGTRRPSGVGRQVAVALGRGLGAAGVTVVSGAALGVDAAAHRGALEVGGDTVAVLGSGIDVAHPKTNAPLLERIVRVGTVVSEYPPGVPAEPHRFPARNRLIAALSEAVVVVEGAARSGTRITADHAQDLGVEVFAVPGAITNPLSQTPLELLREGGRPIRGPADLLDDLGLPHDPAAAPLRELPPDERLVFDRLSEAMLPDAAAAAAGLPITRTVAALLDLEIRGLVRGVGGRYERVFAPPVPPAPESAEDRTT